MSKPMVAFQPGPSTQVRRKDRIASEPDAAQRIIDESLVAHVAFTTADGVAQCLPMAFGRIGSTIYLHGAVANTHLQALTGKRCSLTFTLLDGFVFARSAFHHSMNYRCAVVVGQTRLVTEPEEKSAALTALVNHAAPGRSGECIGMTEQELRATRVLAVDVDEAVAKRRSGPPIDQPEDVTEGSVFAGVVELRHAATSLTRDPQLSRAVALPPSIEQFSTRFGAPGVAHAKWGEFTLSSDPSRIDKPWLHDMLSEHSYWAKGIGADKLASCLAASLVFGVYQRDRQVAFARAFSDVSRMAYLADVFVDPEHRGKGIGKRLVAFVLEHPAVAACDRVLLATRDAATFYAPFGFQKTENVYLVRQQRRD